MKKFSRETFYLNLLFALTITVGITSADLECDFETNCTDTWKYETRHWKVEKAGHGSKLKNDHTFGNNTSGHYLIAQPSKKNDKYSLISRIILYPAKNACLIFSAYFEGNITLKIYSPNYFWGDTLFKTISLSDGSRKLDKWITLKLALNGLPVMHKLKMSAQFASTSGFLALDDLSLSETTCNNSNDRDNPDGIFKIIERVYDDIMVSKTTQSKMMSTTNILHSITSKLPMKTTQQKYSTKQSFKSTRTPRPVESISTTAFLGTSETSKPASEKYKSANNFVVKSSTSALLKNTRKETFKLIVSSSQQMPTEPKEFRTSAVVTTSIQMRTSEVPTTSKELRTSELPTTSFVEEKTTKRVTNSPPELTDDSMSTRILSSKKDVTTEKVTEIVKTGSTSGEQTITEGIVSAETTRESTTKFQASTVSSGEITSGRTTGKIEQTTNSTADAHADASSGHSGLEDKYWYVIGGLFVLMVIGSGVLFTHFYKRHTINKMENATITMEDSSSYSFDHNDRQHLTPNEQNVYAEP